MSLSTATCLSVGDLQRLLAGVSPETPLEFDPETDHDVVVTLHWIERPSNAHRVIIHTEETEETAA